MIAVLADDISGAAELANSALRHGLSAEVQTEFDPASAADVVCVDTDSRSLPAEAAAEAAGRAARALARARPAWIYKKCDSVLRGQVRAEFQAIMAGSGRPRGVLISANPSRGRVIRDGHFFVQGQPLHETAFARDPEHPRTTSRVAALLGGDLGGMEVPDVATAADLERAAAGMEGATLAGGGVDFFEALLARHGFRPTAAEPRPAARERTLLICGSAAAWGQRQQQARERGLPLFHLPLHAREVAAALRTGARVVIGIGDGPATENVAPAVLTGRLAEASALVLQEDLAGRVLLEGGATAAAIVRRLGWTRLAACEVAAPGTGTLLPVGLARPLLSIKPGSYDWPPELWG